MVKRIAEVREEQIKNVVARLYFNDFNCTNIEGNIDFSVTDNNITQDNLFYQKETEYYLWAEAKNNKQKDIYKLFVQLILTIGKSKKLRSKIPPKFLGAIDPYQIAFVPYETIQDIFSINNFNWNVTPSNYETDEFSRLYKLVSKILSKKSCIFKFNEDEKDLRKFIKNNFKKGKNSSFAQIEITKSNFVAIYTRWLDEVKESIDINWSIAKRNNILDADFYLADVLSENNHALANNQYINTLLKGDHYEFNRQKNEYGSVNVSHIGFKDNQQAHHNFWMKYKRPPKNAYQDYIIEKRPLLVPQDVREIKGAYFTPQIWVQKSQEYLADVLGDNWQEEYYIWDCCAGTGNMENGLVNKYNVWASTLDQPDVDVMIQRVKNGANLLESHIFQMDFLNDKFEDKCPKDLLEILNDPKKRKKLVIYINPPYVEADNRIGEGRSGAALNNVIYEKYKDQYGKSIRELFIQFFVRIYNDIPNCIIGEFSTLKMIQAPNFTQFRDSFKAKLEKSFIVPANTFDNVKGQFPIGFFIWNTAKKEDICSSIADVFDKDGDSLGQKTINVYTSKFINDWVKTFKNSDKKSIATIIGVGNDFQNQRTVRIEKPHYDVPADNHHWEITSENLLESSIYFAVRLAIPHLWLNDRDQYLYPNNRWKSDIKFKTNCLVYTLFHSQNHIKSKDGVNNWIPFIEKEVQPQNGFKSHFMTDYIESNDLDFSKEAQNVLAIGKELWRYYHSQSNSNPNASYYDIREYFQGKENGRMNNSSSDETYSILIWNLRQAMRKLEKAIIPKIYKYGFLKK